MQPTVWILYVALRTASVDMDSIAELQYVEVKALMNRTGSLI